MSYIYTRLILPDWFKHWHWPTALRDYFFLPRKNVCGLGSWKTFASTINITWNGEPSTACVNIVIIKYSKEGLKRGRGKINIFLTMTFWTLFLTSLHLHISSVTKLAQNLFLSNYLMGRYFNIVSNYLNCFFILTPEFSPSFSFLGPSVPPGIYQGLFYRC